MTRQPADPIAATLRVIRNRLGLSLQGVEDKSAGRWKGVVVGSYERGDRQPTVRQVRELLAFYGGRRLEVVGPGDLILADRAARDGGSSYVEHLVVYGVNLDGTITCGTKGEAETIVSYMPGARLAYRTHIVGDLIFDFAVPGGVL